jgi:ElaB/YqjD/DUF883 family membrane-anchored ribosome-binding protein
MKSAAKKIFHTPGDVSAPTTHRVASVAHEAIDGIAEKAEPVEQRLRDQAIRTGEQLEATQLAATEQIQQSMQKVETFIRERPIAASGIAFAAGILAAAILRR